MLKGRSPLLFAALFALAAAVATWFALARTREKARAGWDLVPVLVAAKQLPEGSLVSVELLAKSALPEQFATPSVVRPESLSLVEGQRLKMALRPGDLLLWSHFESAQTGELLSPLVQKRGRAFAIQVGDPATSVGGWVRPNDHVDVIGTFRDPKSSELIASTLMQNVVVLATGRSAGAAAQLERGAGERTYTTVSLLVLPEEAELLTLASELGTLSLTLRNPEDFDVQEERTRATAETLITGERMRSLESRRYRTIQVIRGTESKSSFGGAE